MGNDILIYRIYSSYGYILPQTKYIKSDCILTFSGKNAVFFVVCLFFSVLSPAEINQSHGFAAAALIAEVIPEIKEKYRKEGLCMEKDITSG